jgi:hypothetical protein
LIQENKGRREKKRKKKSSRGKKRLIDIENRDRCNEYASCESRRQKKGGKKERDSFERVIFPAFPMDDVVDDRLGFW